MCAESRLKSTMRTREYIEKGESEGKSLLDAMRDGSTTDGMQHFDAEIERPIREGTIDADTGFTYAANAGNLRLEMADFLEEQRRRCKPQKPKESDTEFEFTR